MNRAWTAAVIAAAALLAPLAVGAQTDPRLKDAVRLAQEGHSDSARAVVGRLLSATPPTDSLYPEILYAEAMVASDAGEMRTHLQRIAVEYGGSSWADDGILRLVQMDYATHNLSGAAKNLEKLRSDYPASPLLPQASYWAGRVYFDQSNPTDACRWLAEGLAQSEGDIELQNQLRYLNQRCTTAAVSDTGAMPRDSAMAAPGPPGKTVYRVQIAAVASGDAAADTEKKARALGLTVETVLEKNLYKVRAGRYSSRTEAQAAAAGLKVKLGGNPFVVAEP